MYNIYGNLPMEPILDTTYKHYRLEYYFCNETIL